MAILSTVKKVIPYIKDAAGYILCHISSQAVEMDDGTLLQNKIELMDTEIDGKAPNSHTHPVTQVTGLTNSRALISDASGHPAVSNVTSTELNCLDGATGNIQSQIDELNSNLSNIQKSVEGLNGKLLLFTAPNTEEITIPSKGYVQTSLYLPEIQGKYIVGASIIGARTPSYVPQIYVAGFSRQGTTDVNVYFNLYNAYTSSLSNAFQIGIWYADEP